MVGTCGSCLYFEQMDKNQGNGVCRRYPPVIVTNAWSTAPTLMMPGKETRAGTTQSEIQAVSGQFAPTHRDLWCGEYSEKFNKEEAN